MKSLYEHFGELSKSYYGIRIHADRLFDFEEKSKKECREFIDDHFIKGKKENALDIPKSYMKEYKKNGKHQHTVVLYLLGLLLEQNVSLPLRDKMDDILGVCLWYDYKYTWYLTCLFHDVTSVIEKKRTPEERAQQIEKMGKSKLFLQDNRIFRFSKELYGNYAYYRNSKESLEHGIIAGTKLFDALHRSFEKNTKGHNWLDEPAYYKAGMTWRREHIPHFAYIADAICCHNIWFAPEKDKELCEAYKKANLGELIIRGDEDKLSFEEYPLQFILCLLDTIEPIKRFRCKKPTDVLENIFFEVGSNKITIGWNSCIKQHEEFWNWLVPITKLPEWMRIKVSPCCHKDNRCYITLAW